MKAPHRPSRAALDAASQLHRSALRLLRVLRVARPGEGLSASRLGILGRLQRGGMTTGTALAAYLRVQPQSLTRVLEDLEKRSLITRRPGTEDRRQSLLEITDEGVRMLTGAVRDQRESLSRVIAEMLTPEEQELLRLCAGVMDRLSEALEASHGE